MSTLIFPQLATGGLAQFPIRKHVVRRTIVNRSVGDSSTRMPDPEAALTAWDLQYTGLTDTEIESFETLFKECEGRLKSFLFVDPLGNLLRWTEDLTKDVWETGLLVSIGSGDPAGTAGACRLTNGAQAPQSMSQSVDAPGSYTYTFSVWVKSESTRTVRLALAGGLESLWVSRQVGNEWELVSVSGSVGGSEAQVRCVIEVPGGSSIDVYGPQMDAQPDASGYRKNSAKSSVSMARFDQDELERVSHGPDSHSTFIRIVTVRG